MSEIKITLDMRLLNDKDIDFFHYDQSYPLAKCEEGEWYIVSRGDLECDYYDDFGNWITDDIYDIQHYYVRNNEELAKAIDEDKLRFDMNNWFELEFYNNNGDFDEYDEHNYTDECFGSISEVYKDFLQYIKEVNDEK